MQQPKQESVKEAEFERSSQAQSPSVFILKAKLALTRGRSQPGRANGSQGLQ